MVKTLKCKETYINLMHTYAGLLLLIIPSAQKKDVLLAVHEKILLHTKILISWVAVLVVLPFGSKLPLYRFRLSTNIFEHHTKQCPGVYWIQNTPPLYLAHHVLGGDTGSIYTTKTLSLALWEHNYVLCWGCQCNNISSCRTDTGFARNNYRPSKRSDWWYRSGVICTCNHKLLIGY